MDTWSPVRNGKRSEGIADTQLHARLKRLLAHAYSMTSVALATSSVDKTIRYFCKDWTRNTFVQIRNTKLTTGCNVVSTNALKS